MTYEELKAEAGRQGYSLVELPNYDINIITLNLTGDTLFTLQANAILTISDLIEAIESASIIDFEGLRASNLREIFDTLDRNHIYYKDGTIRKIIREEPYVRDTHKDMLMYLDYRRLKDIYDILDDYKLAAIDEKVIEIIEDILSDLNLITRYRKGENK